MLELRMFTQPFMQVNIVTCITELLLRPWDYCPTVPGMGEHRVANAQ